jgi:hypothetical protein
MAEDFRRWFGDQIADQGLTAVRLSRLLAIGPGTVEEWLTGRSLPSRGECLRLAELLEAPSFVVLDLAGYNPG